MNTKMSRTGKIPFAYHTEGYDLKSGVISSEIEFAKNSLIMPDNVYD